VAIVYEEKKNVVRVTGQFCAEELKKKLLCKLGKVIIDIKVELACDKKVKKILDLCLEEHVEIRKSIDIAKKECVQFCKKLCTETCEGTCKKRCEENCNKGCEQKICKPVCPDKCKQECSSKPKCKITCEPECIPAVTPPKPAPCKELQLQVTICCSSPCPCFVPSCNNYRCCSCGVVGFPGWFGTGWGTGPGYCGGRPSWGVESSYCPTNVAIIGGYNEPSCSIM
jgi:hypothetical protein